jgi:4-amino-4-deoxy-L-arabinose transferase-like glycosyltransferase
MGLMPQDAYYYLYGQNLSWSYFDHPGMIGYLLRFTSELLGQSVFVVKLTDFLVTSSSLYFFYLLARHILPIYKAKQALVLLVSTLFISIISFNSTPDVPLILFWTLSVLALYKAIFEDKKGYWILAGIAMGLAFNSKYTSLFLQIGLIGFLLFSNRYRKLFFSPWLYVCLILSVVLTVPVFYWNYEHEFASFLFQSSNRTDSISEFKLTPKYFFGAIGHQLFLLLPILFSVFVTFTFKYVRRFFTKLKLPGDQQLFLLAFFIPTFLGFFALTPIYWVKLNWMMPSYITGVILAIVFFNKKLFRYQLIISGIFHVLIAVEVLFYIVPIKSDDTWVGWGELSVAIDEIQKQYPDTFIFSDDNYKTSAALNFYQDEKVYAQNIIGKPALHFDYLGDDLATLEGKNALFIDSDKRIRNEDKKTDIDPSLRSYFSEIKELEPIIIRRNGKMVRKFWVFYCQNYTKK